MMETELYFSFKKSSRFYSEGFLSYFTTIFNEFSWLKQFGKLFEVGNQQINWLFYNNVNQFIWYTNHFHDFLTINFCFDFFIR